MHSHFSKWAKQVGKVKKVSKMLTMRLKGTAKEDSPRSPPPAPTPLSFPRAELGNGSPQIPPELPYDAIYKIITLCPRGGPTVEHLRSFNIQLAHDVSLEALIPVRYIPPSKWLVEPTDTAELSTFPVPSSPPPESLLSNGHKIPNRSDFLIRVTELLYSTDDAFAVLQRKKLPPGKDLRLGHFRKLYDKLLLMAEYWDTSKDNYISAPSDDEDQAGTYTGRRISCGSKMPASYREDAVQEFVMTIALCFGCRAVKPSIDPKLGFESMRQVKFHPQSLTTTHFDASPIPVPQTGAIYRTPSDKTKAKQRILEGPIASITARAGYDFHKDGETHGAGKIECLDLAREIGCALVLAQKRNKEGTAKTEPGEGKWWVEKPRWGGAEGPEIDPKTPRSDLKNLNIWKRLLPPSSELEKSIDYMRIGKAKGKDYDDIYLISALNHHLSILRVRVPDKYMEHITNGPAASGQSASGFVPAKEPWFKLEVGRSQWYDLLKAEDRAEAMRGVWGIMAVMMRAE